MDTINVLNIYIKSTYLEIKCYFFSIFVLCAYQSNLYRIKLKIRTIKKYI